MTMDLGRVGFESEPRRITWSPADCSLYALSLGAGFDELAFVAENATGHPQRVFPTFVLAGVMARESASWTHPGFHTGDYAVHQIVLGQVRLELFGRVEPSGDVLVRTRVDGIYDKGRSALVELAVQADDRKSGKPLFRAVNALFVRGEGGFGGPPAPARPDAGVPDRAPDHQSAQTTFSVQSLLYRHGGQDLGHRGEAERSIGVARRDHGTVGGAHRGGGVIDRPAVDLVERTLHSADRTGL